MDLLGVDTGGTFTDFVHFDGVSLVVHKVLSTPEAPERAILQGIQELGLLPQLEQLTVIHGSTVATNAVLEGKGVRTVYIGNRGLADLLTIGRQARSRLYDLAPRLPPLPVPPELCLESGGRLAADGAVVEPLTASELAELVAAVSRLAPRAVAINLLFSFRDDRFERAIAEALPAGLFISRSSVVLPEYREYERGIATWLNAWVGPLVEGYLQRLADALTGARVQVMQSAGTTIAARQAGTAAVRLLLSGPAGGLAGAAHIAQVTDCGALLTFDMGGTSTDVALVDGRPALTSEGQIGPWPVAVAQVDMHTIGAGGGSIARIDGGGMLQVGPESAGASPGPACYGRGGVEPTVTDANLVLGRLRADRFLGGAMALEPAAARAALEPIAQALGGSIEDAALGVVAVANEHMARALRVMSVRRGVDPRTLTLACFGGAGGLHVCALAEALGMTRALVPIHAGVLSALGMLAARRGRHLSRTVGGRLAEQPAEGLMQGFAELEREGRAALSEEGVAEAAVEVQRSLDLRYAGQSYTLEVAWAGVAESVAAFHRSHAERYGHQLDLPVELVNLRLVVEGPDSGFALTPLADLPTPQPTWGEAVGSGPVAIWERELLPAGFTLVGPALITERVATIWLDPGWQATIDPSGNLLLVRLP